MSQRFEAFKEEYDALCKKYNVHIAAWYDYALAVYDLDHRYADYLDYLDLKDSTSKTNNGKETRMNYHNHDTVLELFDGTEVGDGQAI